MEHNGCGHYRFATKWPSLKTGLGQHGQGKIWHGAMWPWEIDRNLVEGLSNMGS